MTKDVTEWYLNFGSLEPRSSSFVELFVANHYKKESLIRKAKKSMLARSVPHAFVMPQVYYINGIALSTSGAMIA